MQRWRAPRASEGATGPHTPFRTKSNTAIINDFDPEKVLGLEGSAEMVLPYVSCGSFTQPDA